MTRISQGSGVFMCTDVGLDDFVTLGARAVIDLSLFARPNAGWSASPMARSGVGPLIAPVAHGADQLAAVIDDIFRAANHGIGSVLIEDIGVLSVFDALRRAGRPAADMQAKVSVMLPVANPASARVIAGLGASTIKLPTDLTVRDRRDTCGRRCSDVYVECPDNLGGFTRYQQIPELVRVAAPSICSSACAARTIPIRPDRT